MRGTLSLSTGSFNEDGWDFGRNTEGKKNTETKHRTGRETLNGSAFQGKELVPTGRAREEKKG